MREYGQIQCSFWSDPDVQSLSSEAKLLAAYLLTGPHSNGLGCYRLPAGYVNADLGWSTETISKAFKELIDSVFIIYCERTNWLLIPKFLEWNPIANPKVAAARIKEAREVPTKSMVWSPMVEALYAYARKHLPEDFSQILEEEWRPAATRIHQKIKSAVWERDGGKCTECGTDKDVTYDHIRPIIYGGQHTEENLRLLCRSCNSKWFPGNQDSISRLYGNGFDTVSKQDPTLTNPEPNPEPNPDPNPNPTLTKDARNADAQRAPRTNGKAKTTDLWEAYGEAYQRRYGVLPVRNAKVNSQLSRFIDRIGAAEAPFVAAYFLTSNNSWYVRQGHSVDCLLKDAEKLRTEWLTRRQVTNRQANELDRKSQDRAEWEALIQEAENAEQHTH